MDHVRGKSYDEIEVIDWEDASMQCGGDERDDAFLVELLIIYYEDGLPRMKKLLQAALAYRAGATTLSAEGDPRAIESVIKEEAHALKGSAANVRLWRLAKAAEDTELPCKAVLQSSAPAEARASLLARFCLAPCVEIGTLAREFRLFVAFVQKDMARMVSPEVDIGSSLDDALRATLQTISLEAYDAEMAPFVAFFSPQAQKQQPSAGGGGSSGGSGSSATTSVAAAAPPPIAVGSSAAGSSAGGPPSLSPRDQGVPASSGMGSRGASRSGSLSPTLRGVLAGGGSARIAPAPALEGSAASATGGGALSPGYEGHTTASAAHARPGAIEGATGTSGAAESPPVGEAGKDT